MQNDTYFPYLIQTVYPDIFGSKQSGGFLHIAYKRSTTVIRHWSTFM